MLILPPAAPSAKLPAGKTCSDCCFFLKCRWLLSRTGTETECDWAPSKFQGPGTYPGVLSAEGQ